MENYNLNPKQKIYEHKLNENHAIFINVKTLTSSYLTGTELA